MEVWALSGPSGTGKSTAALEFAHENNVEAIIDDGILIYKGNKIAGSSAKFEKNYISAVKRATFHNEDHLAEVRKNLEIYNINKVLILGTSKKMVQIIAERLGLNKIDYHFCVEDVRSSSQIKIALFIRQTEKTHVMPVPSHQIETSLIKKLIYHGKKIFSPKKELLGENTIVQPSFHRDAIQISEQALKDVIEAGCTSIKEVNKCQKVIFHTENLPNLKVFLTINYSPGLNMYKVAKRVKAKINEDFKYYLNLELNNIDISITKLYFKRKA